VGTRGPASRKRHPPLRAVASVCLLAAAIGCPGDREPQKPQNHHGFASVAPTTPPAIRAEMSLVAAWQLAHPEGEPHQWTNAVLYAGIMAAYRATADPDYLAVATRMAASENWQPGPRTRHADDHAIAQTYLDLSRIHDDPRMREPFRAVLEDMMAQPPRWKKKYQTIDYWWADALFMSPPAVAKLSRLTGDDRYLHFLDRLWRQAHELLYDAEENLFYRDARYLPKAGGTKIFWSRANGWVLAGTALLLDEMPEDHPGRLFYVEILEAMARRVSDLQPPDGLWRSALLGPSPGAPGETSATALFCYALAWGVNRGFLDRNRSLPVIRRAWAGLHRNLDVEGRLGWVQPPAAEPGTVTESDTAPYGAGAFLLAASEMLELAEQTGTSSRRDPTPEPSDN